MHDSFSMPATPERDDQPRAAVPRSIPPRFQGWLVRRAARLLKMPEQRPTARRKPPKALRAVIQANEDAVRSYVSAHLTLSNATAYAIRRVADAKADYLAAKAERLRMETELIRHGLAVGEQFARSILEDTEASERAADRSVILQIPAGGPSKKAEPKKLGQRARGETAGAPRPRKSRNPSPARGKPREAGRRKSNPADLNAAQPEN